MDIQMPEMDGLEATRAIRNIEMSSGQHLPIIAMTANTMMGDRELCMPSGMDGYLTKPLSPKELFATIESLPVAAQTVSPWFSSPEDIAGTCPANRNPVISTEQADEYVCDL
jgi:CheY-like chemotaxis protein